MTVLGSDTIIIIRPPARDWQGDRTGEPAETPVPGCIVQPSGSQESQGTGDTVISGYAAWLPEGTDIRDTDRVQLADGTICAVDGRPEPWHDDLGADGHIRVMLRATEGK